MPVRARIYQPPKTAMQSGTAGTHRWALVYETGEPGRADPLMGWIGGADTQAQVKLSFATKEEAVAYAEQQGLVYEVELPHGRTFRPKAYADNFRFGRLDNWTH